MISNSGYTHLIKSALSNEVCHQESPDQAPGQEKVRGFDHFHEPVIAQDGQLSCQVSGAIYQPVPAGIRLFLFFCRYTKISRPSLGGTTAKGSSSRLGAPSFPRTYCQSLTNTWPVVGSHPSSETRSVLAHWQFVRETR